MLTASDYKARRDFLAIVAGTVASQSAQGRSKLLREVIELDISSAEVLFTKLVTLMPHSTEQFRAEYIQAFNNVSEMLFQGKDRLRE